MKRWIAIILATVTLASLLVGCNNSSPASSSYVTVWLRTEHVDHYGSHRYVYTYDETGNIIKEETYLKDELFSQTEYTYNNGQLIEVVYPQMYSGGNTIRRRYSYDNNGNKLTEWYTTNGEEYTYQYTYDEHGNPIETLKDYQLHTRWEYQYDSSGNILKETRYDLSSDQRHVYMYDSSGNEYAYTFYSEGELYRQEEYTYDTTGNRIEKIEEWGDGRSYRYEYSYDAHGNKIKESKYLYNTNPNNYTLSSWEEYTYDENGCLTSIIDSDGDTTDTYTYIEMQLTAEQVEKLKNNPYLSYLMVIKE